METTERPLESFTAEEQLEISNKPTAEEAKPTENQPNQDPAALAAHNLPAMLAWYKNLVTDTGGKFGGTHAKAVLVALSEMPFNETPPVFTTQEQYDVYQLGMQIFNAKFLILMASLRDAANQKKSENKEEKKESESNGNQEV